MRTCVFRYIPFPQLMTGKPQFKCFLWVSNLWIPVIKKQKHYGFHICCSNRATKLQSNHASFNPGDYVLCAGACPGQVPWSYKNNIICARKKQPQCLVTPTVSPSAPLTIWYWVYTNWWLKMTSPNQTSFVYMHLGKVLYY